MMTYLKSHIIWLIFYRKEFPKLPKDIFWYYLLNSEKRQEIKIKVLTETKPKQENREGSEEHCSNYEGM